MLSEIYSTTRATRRNALDKLAVLSAESTTSSTAEDNGRDINRLCALGGAPAAQEGNGTLNGAYKGHRIASIPMSIKELEVLLALCKAAPLVQTTRDAESLLRQLGPYVREAHRQAFEATPLYQQMPPWEMLAFDLTTAILALGVNHPSLRPEAWSIIDDTIEELVRSAEDTAWLKPLENGETEVDINDQTLRAIQLNVSVLGFYRGIAKYVRVWSPEQRMDLIPQLRRILSEKFMVSLGGALSAVRNSNTTSRVVKDWKRWTRQYASKGQPLGAMLLQQAFMEIVEESCLALIPLTEPLRGTAFLNSLIQRKPSKIRASSRVPEDIVHSLTDVIANEMKYLDADADYLKLGSPWQQRLAREVKASALRSFLCCCILDGDNANAEVLHTDILKGWLDAVTSDSSQMIDEDLAQTVLKCMTILASLSAPIASDLTRSLPRLIVQGKMSPPTATVASECIARILKYLPQDVVISTLYNLGNVLSTDSDNRANSKSPLFDGTLSSRHGSNFGPQPAASAISLVFSSSDDDDVATTYGTVIQAIVAIAVARSEIQLTALVISMLVQKIGRINLAVDSRIIVEIAALGLCGGPNELKSLLRLYVRIGTDALMNSNNIITAAVNEARIRLANWIRKDTPLFEIYLTHLLSLCVSSGDTAGDRTVDVAFASKTIAQLFGPIAILVSSNPEQKAEIENEDELRALGRDTWFNIVVLGFTWQSAATKEHMKDLQTMALYSLPLIDEARVDMPESSIDLNAVLRRGSSPQHLVQQKQSLIAALPGYESDIKGLSYQECNFLNAALLISTLRAQGGDSTAVLPYFLENKVKTTALGNCMLAVAEKSVAAYLQKSLSGRSQDYAAPQVALQLATLFEGCCHRISKVQVAALTMCDRIINEIPSALCQKASLFALLELLTLMWKACLDSETDEYTWRSHYSSFKGNVSVQLSDDFSYRKSTLSSFHQRCRLWVAKAIDLAPLDVKGLLQAYLEDYEDDGAYGHIALGRSFAVEMGALIPSTDQRLTSLERQRDVGINTASDFVAQYTTRQEYRHLDGKHMNDDEWALVDYSGQSHDALVDVEGPVQDEAAELRNLARRLRNHAIVPFAEVRETLRNAAGILSQSASDRVALIQDLVAIPFLIFSKQSINLGISLWLGIIKENPSIESRILVEVAAGWEASVRRKKGFFDTHFQHLDPFYVKEEFAPSSWDAIKRREQITHNLISPHLRLTHFLSSHFSASRLTSPSVERVYSRVMRITLLAMRKVVSQPLAREVHFHIILLAQKVLRYSVNLDATTQWRLKDAIISAGLSWFRTSPRWSFGSNRLQLKAETKLLNDVANMFRTLSGIGSRTSRSLPPLQPKQDLLLNLISHEIGRVSVWITPLDQQSKGLLSGSHEGATQEASIAPLLKTAWDEDPSIAIQLCTRFVKSQAIHSQVRQLLLQHPEKAIDEPDALYILLGAELPSDIKTQLKYLLYWAPVNPMAAVTYFLPAYANHPFIVQYAVRALEAHSVDITFFYVPQIVQTLRYDSLGYVERYIIETAAFSQLFAHQIIWNMKANAYKDEDSEEPDPVKPVLDRVMDALISSFLPEDKDFYEREFDFFGKVTGISGTLKPFIKRPKPEKKQKIEEELRKIQVEVGVYLPSNPDGVVIGIDRKSGKPLQSHAKAPFMATFRIRKEESEQEAAEEAQRTGQLQKRKQWEVWQSAIFKVGDDCRQDVLALQMIAAFRGIFNNVGLDVYVFPYRVTATAPGCGVIDVLPSSISRDMLGREAVNGLYEYFVSKYGYEDSIRFQEARGNFVKSMAAYSIISYLLQFKDRHNGNIMVDDAGHILHIDFGFCFDIAPGGVKFERAPFKLTPEMVAVMGGSVDSQAFRAFEELCVKAFLASRQYVEQLAHIVETMLDSGLPCFKPQTIQHFKERFVLEKSDREAAKFVRHLIHVSERSWSTAGYDYFQLLTNGIPY